jgi:hypothetical protein
VGSLALQGGIEKPFGVLLAPGLRRAAGHAAKPSRYRLISRRDDNKTAGRWAD